MWDSDLSRWFSQREEWKTERPEFILKSSHWVTDICGQEGATITMEISSPIYLRILERAYTRGLGRLAVFY